MPDNRDKIASVVVTGSMLMVLVMLVVLAHVLFSALAG